MKRDIEEIVEVPENVQVEIVGELITIKSSGKEIKSFQMQKNIGTGAKCLMKWGVQLMG